jgi:hypothetical protein
MLPCQKFELRRCRLGPALDHSPFGSPLSGQICRLSEIVKGDAEIYRSVVAMEAWRASPLVSAEDPSFAALVIAPEASA